MKNTTSRRRNDSRKLWRNDLAQERRRRGLSLGGASRILRIPLQTLSHYERGDYAPSLLVALKLQILYRGQVASFYDTLYAELTKEIRAAELLDANRGGTR